jgi:citrate lyase subunit beta / citryl-CoA lyase
MTMIHRSYLFVPATRIERISKAQASGAGAVIVDLEDAVATHDNDAARQALHKWLININSEPVFVRINACDTPWYAEDSLICNSDKVLGVVVPKAEDSLKLEQLTQNLKCKPLLPLIETGLGFHQILNVAKVPSVTRLIFGTIDFKKDMNISDEDHALLYFRSHLVLTSRVAGLQPPVDGVTTAIDDLVQVRQDALRAASLGFGGKLCIHPNQIGAVEQAFLPSPAEIEWAQRVLKAASKSFGAAVVLDGQMIDKPVIERAQLILGRSVH